MSQAANTQPDFSIISVNYNNAELLIKVLERTVTALADFRYEVILVDNGSTDDSLKALEQHFQDHPFIRIINSGRNGGFGYGCNTGAKQARAPVLWFLNSDAWVSTTDGLNQTLALARRNSTGIVGTSVLLENSSATPQGGGDMSFGFFLLSSFRLGAAFRHLPRSWQTKMIRPLSRLRGGLGRYAKSFSHHATQSAFISPSVGGASFLIRSSVYAQMNGFDEGYFLYDEDIDLCLRCLKNNYQNWVSPNVITNTYPSATTSRVPSIKLKLIKRSSRRRLINLHFQGVRRILLLLATEITWLLL